MIPVTKPYLPSLEKYQGLIQKTFQANQLTNNGPLVKELTCRLEECLDVKNLLLTSSGTMALQMAYKIKKLERKKTITTPFTFHGTYSSLDWMGIDTDFSDVSLHDWNLDPKGIEQLLASGKTIDCILPVHTFGVPARVEQFEALQKKYNFDIIYDAAHALTTRDKNKRSLLTYGDVSCFSLHATKLFHTCEGGGIVFNNTNEFEEASAMINFGLINGIAEYQGINGKMSEVHAAMGLALLDDLPFIEQVRADLISVYKSELAEFVQFQGLSEGYYISPSYLPILLETEQSVLEVQCALEKQHIFPRRYFYPPIHKMPVAQEKFAKSCFANSENISSRVLCLPLYFDLTKNEVLRVCKLIKETLIK